MGTAERRQREKEKRKKEILDAAKRLFFSKSYDDVSMDEIADAVELNKATLYLYYKNKEALFAAVVLLGVKILKEKYQRCMETKTFGIVKVALMGQAYYEFSQENPDYLRLIHFYGSERFSKENPYTEDIGKGYGVCRKILSDAIRQGIEDKTIRSDINPFSTSMYLMISFMNILSLENKWKKVISNEGISFEKFAGDFFKFIFPAIANTENKKLGIQEILSSEGFLIK
ncbi:MAG: TetR/AcrR family transcriptional regulator [Methanomicrobium sp.]|nr:TetR/AcrR family transcriptional regulator [Methanomicrobium sp.]